MQKAKQLLLLSFCCISSLISLYSEEKINPVKEKAKLDEIKLITFMPKISLSSVKHQGSIFDAYLDSHKITYSFNDKPLSYHKKIPKTKNEVSYFEDVDAAIDPFERKKITKTPEKEIATNTNEAKGFIYDIIGSLKRRADFIEIMALFHPESSLVRTDTLQSFLSSSIEFKVLSKVNHKKKFTYALSDNQKDLLNSTDSLFSKQQIKSAHIEGIALPTQEVGTFALNTIVKLPSAKAKKAKKIKINTSQLSVPKVLATDRNSYSYKPTLIATQTLVTDDNIITALPITMIPDSEASYTHLNKRFSKDKLLTSTENLIEAPKHNKAIGYLSDIETKSLPKNTLPQTITKVSTELAHESFDLETIHGVTKEKTEIIVLDYDPAFPNKQIKAKKLAQAKIVKNTRPAEEKVNQDEQVVLAIQNPKAKEEYLFKPNSLAKVAIETTHEEKKSLPKQLLDSEISELPVQMLRNLDLIDTVGRRQLPDEILAHNESTTTEEISLDFMGVGDQKIAYFFVPNADNFHEAFTFSAHSPKRFEIDHLFTKSSQKNPLAHLKVRGYETTTNLQVADIEISHDLMEQNLNLDEHAICSTRIDSSLARVKENIFHPLNAKIEAVNLKDELNTKAETIIAEREINPYQNTIDVPLTDLSGEGIEVLSYETGITPDLDQEYLGSVKLAKLSFDTSISLPKLSKVRGKRSFFLNPMDMLMRAGTNKLTASLHDSAKKANHMARMMGYNLFNWPTLDDLKTDSYPESFSLDTRLFASSEDVYDFVCTLKTDQKDVFAPLPLHALFILDTSSSIESHRFKVFKNAILTAIKHLDEDSKFNIAMLDKNGYTLLHEKSMSPSESAISFVKRQLKKVEQSSKVPFDSLITLLKQDKKASAQEIPHHCCLLLSDGNLAKNIRLDREKLDELTNIDAGNFSLYTASVSDKNNNAMLSLLAKTNHGFSLYTKTHSSFPRKFATMLRHIKRPLLHDIHISFPDSEDQSIYFNERISPILLADKSFSFYGNTDSRKRTRVFIQGRSGDRWINILKELPLNEARKARFSLRKKLEGQKTLLSLYSFLKTKDEKYLVDAKNNSKEFDIPLPIP